MFVEFCVCVVFCVENKKESESVFIVFICFVDLTGFCVLGCFFVFVKSFGESTCVFVFVHFVMIQLAKISSLFSFLLFITA